MKIKCACGKLLHYTDDYVKLMVGEMVVAKGEYMKVTVPSKGTFKVPRHYIALHGLKAEEIDKLGFERVA